MLNQGKEEQEELVEQMEQEDAQETLDYGFGFGFACVWYFRAYTVPGSQPGNENENK